MQAITRGILCTVLMILVIPPPHQAAEPARESGFQSLFNGQDLSGWRFPGEMAGDWSVERGFW